MITHQPKALRFAVCLAAYNGVEFIHEQLESILQQKQVDVQVFISVDRSSDGTEEAVAKLASFDPRITLLPFGMHFGSAARNFFRLLHDVDFSGYDYVSFADQDDIWLPEKLIRAHQVITKYQADAYSSNVIAFWQNGRRKLVAKSQKQEKWDFLFEAAGPGCTYVLKTSFAKKLQSFIRAHQVAMQEVALHDWFTYAFARAQGFNWVIDHSPGMLYRQHANNEVGVNMGWKACAHRIGKVLDGWWLKQSLLTANLVGLSNSPFVMKGLANGKKGLFFLGLRAGQCRRRWRDKLMFMALCLTLLVLRKAP